MHLAEDLKQILQRIDRKSYPAYKDLRGSYQFKGYILNIEHVQGDPFAAPSKLSIQMKGSIAGFPVDYYDKSYKKTMLEDYLIRRFSKNVASYSFQAKGSGKSGLIGVSKCGQEVLRRTACDIKANGGDIIVRFEVGFPANGRTVNARELSKILFDFLPTCVEKSCLFSSLNANHLREAIELAEDREYIRSQLSEMGLVAFIAEGSVLPRESGVSSHPMKNGVPFQAPESVKVTMELPNKGKISGMGIKKGVMLIVGGGYHGKSTLLKALESGVYPHIAGDGREYVVTDDTAVKLRAEDGRSIKHTDISMFINDLPNGKDTKAFYTEDASGSTSQAANTIEAMEAGAKVFLIDEDTSATNFMVRDELMQQVIQRDMEPITPFIERVRDLYEEYGISTILVAGSSGAYFQVADCIIQMDKFVPKEITVLAKEAAKAYPALTLPDERAESPAFARYARANRELHKKGRVKIKTLGKDGVQLNYETIDLRYVEQLVDAEQLTSLGYIVKYMEEHLLDGKKSIQEMVELTVQRMETYGMDAVCEKGNVPGNLAVPRKQEIFACLNRYRGLGVGKS